jgi:Zn-dependent membrane protease YugP
VFLCVIIVLFTVIRMFRIIRLNFCYEASNLRYVEKLRRETFMEKKKKKKRKENDDALLNF